MYIPFELALIDVETTDVSLPGDVEIIDVGGLLVNRQLEIMDSFQSLVQPDDLSKITEFTTSLTGITRLDLQRAAKWPQVWKRFAKFTRFSKYRLGTWGSHTDIPWLKQAYSRNELKYPHHKSPLCVMGFTVGVLSEKGVHISGFGLDSFCKKFNLRRPSHRGLADTECMLDLLRELMKEDYTLDSGFVLTDF